MMNPSLQHALTAYAGDAAQRIARTDFATLARIGEILLNAKERGATVFLIGNGGSAATASHVTNDLVKGCRAGDAPGFRAMCLCDSTALVTCLANDFSYAEIFSILLQTYGRPGDVVIAFSGSGNSPNIVHALETARNMGLATIGFGGRDGGKMKALCDTIIIAPTDSMELLEDLHLFYFHNLVCAMRPFLGSAGFQPACERSTGFQPVRLREHAFTSARVENPCSRLIGAIDAGGTKVLCAVMDESGAVLARRQAGVPTADIPAYFKRCAEMLAECATEAGTNIPQLSGVGMNIPGMVSREGRVLGSPSARWGEFEARPLLAASLGTDTVPLFFENDINACALAEKRFGGADGDFVWLTISTGNGGAVVADGKLLRGAANCAGEIGHIKVERENPHPCFCGGMGCLEAHASGVAIARRAGMDAKRCAELAREGDAAALKIFEETGVWLGRALATCANLVNPSAAYIGGGVSNALDLMLPALLRTLAEESLPQCRSMRVERTRLGYEAALLGAAAVCLEGLG